MNTCIVHKIDQFARAGACDSGFVARVFRSTAEGLYCKREQITFFDRMFRMRWFQPCTSELRNPQDHTHLSPTRISSWS